MIGNFKYASLKYKYNTENNDWISHLDQIFFVEVCHIESILQSLVDEGGRVVPGHRLLQQQGLGQDLLRAETAGSQLPLHGSQDLKYQL